MTHRRALCVAIPAVHQPTQRALHHSATRVSLVGAKKAEGSGWDTVAGFSPRLSPRTINRPSRRLRRGEGDGAADLVGDDGVAVASHLEDRRLLHGFPLLYLVYLVYWEYRDHCTDQSGQSSRLAVSVLVYF